MIFQQVNPPARISPLTPQRNDANFARHTQFSRWRPLDIRSNPLTCQTAVHAHPVRQYQLPANQTGRSTSSAIHGSDNTMQFAAGGLSSRAGRGELSLPKRRAKRSAGHRNAAFVPRPSAAGTSKEPLSGAFAKISASSSAIKGMSAGITKGVLDASADTNPCRHFDGARLARVGVVAD